MPASRIFIDSDFSLELRPPNTREVELIGRAAYSIFHGQNSCLLFNPNESLLLPKNNFEQLVIQLSPNLIIETATRLKLFRTGSNLLFSNISSTDKKLTLVLEQIQNELSESATGWGEIIRSLVNQLVVYLLRSHLNLKRSEELELSRVGIVDRRLRRAIEFMHDNCGREISLAEIAASVFVSEFHFARLFKKITATAPHAYLAAIRIERARKLLSETDLNITEIGARVGYNSQSHFTKIFREATGLTPKSFRTSVSESLD